MNSFLRDTLLAWYEESEGDKVFPVVSIKRSWSSVKEAAALSNRCRFHDMRHTFASRLVMKGVPLRTVRKILGHKTIAMTERYSHMSDDHMDDAVEASIHYKNTTKVSVPAVGGSANPAILWHAREDSNLRPADSKSEDEDLS